MASFHFNPLDILHCPPLTYNLNYIKYTTKTKLAFYESDYTKKTIQLQFDDQNQCQNKMKRKMRRRRFEREVMARWFDICKINVIDNDQELKDKSHNMDELKKKDSSEVFDFKTAKSFFNDQILFNEEYYHEFFDQPVNYVDWENQIVYDFESDKNDCEEVNQDFELKDNSFQQSDSSQNNIHSNHDQLLSKADLLATKNHVFDSQTYTRQFINSILNTTPWESQIIYSNLSQFSTTPQIYINDPNLLLDSIEKSNHKKYSYNISNDKYYEIKRKNNNLDNLGIVHSKCAQKMETCKTWINEDDLRNWHRPNLKFLKLDEIISKHKKSNEKNHSLHHFDDHNFITPLPLNSPINSIYDICDLSLSDSNSFSLFEFAEEYPILMNNPGMVSLLTLYVPTDEESDILSTNQESKYHVNLSSDSGHSHIITHVGTDQPFLIKLTKPTLAITNNLYRGRIYKHEVNDYLMIINQNDLGKNSHNFIDLRIRKIESIYTVGQTFPNEEVFAPHSRRLNIFCKNRLKQFVISWLNKDKGNSVKKNIISQSVIDNSFPQFTDGSKRKWLKEYCESVKINNEVKGYKLKDMNKQSENENNVTPELACIYESMCWGELRLRDMGVLCNYNDETKKSVRKDFGGRENVSSSRDLNESNTTLEQNLVSNLSLRSELTCQDELLLTPWSLSKNYLSFLTNKSNIEIIGKGDYTGIGEGISFIKNINEEKDKNHFISEIWKTEECKLKSDSEIGFNIMECETQNEMKNEIRKKESVKGDYIIIKRIINGKKEEEIIYDSKVIEIYLQERKKVKINEIEKNSKMLKCGACGEIGHMKTNKGCMFFMKNNKKDTKISVKKSKGLLQMFIMDVINKCTKMNFSSAFLRPVSVKKFPDYQKIVAVPIDLGTMKSKCKNNQYKKFDDFLSDLKLMHSNCVKYNGESHGLSILAKKMWDEGTNIKTLKLDEIHQVEEIIENENRNE